MYQYQAPEQITAIGKANLDIAVNFATITLQGAERMLDLQLKAVKDVIAQGAKNAKALSEVKDVQQALALQSTVAQPSLEKALDYSRSVYEVASDTQSQIAKLFETRVAEFNSNMVAAVDKAAKSAPAGSEMALVAVKTALAAANTAYDSMTKAAKQVKEMTEANVAAAASTARATNGSKRKSN